MWLLVDNFNFPYHLFSVYQSINNLILQSDTSWFMPDVLSFGGTRCILDTKIYNKRKWFWSQREVGSMKALHHTGIVLEPINCFFKRHYRWKNGICIGGGIECECVTEGLYIKSQTFPNCQHLVFWTVDQQVFETDKKENARATWEARKLFSWHAQKKFWCIFKDY